MWPPGRGDARGDDQQAIAVLDAALIRLPHGPSRELFEAQVHLAELKHRTWVDPDDDLPLQSCCWAPMTLASGR